MNNETETKTFAEIQRDLYKSMLVDVWGIITGLGMDDEIEIELSQDNTRLWATWAVLRDQLAYVAGERTDEEMERGWGEYALCGFKESWVGPNGELADGTVQEQS